MTEDLKKKNGNGDLAIRRGDPVGDSPPRRFVEEWAPASPPSYSSA